MFVISDKRSDRCFARIGIIFDKNQPNFHGQRLLNAEKKVSSPRSFEHYDDLDDSEALQNFRGFRISRKCAAKFPRVRFVARKW